MITQSVKKRKGWRLMGEIRELRTNRDDKIKLP